MRVLVNGGTGLIGRAAAQALAERGHTVRILSRTGRTAGAHPSGRIETARGDVLDPASLPAANEGVDVVVHAVQFPNHPIQNPRKGYTYERVDGDGTGNAVLAARQAGVRRFVYVSGAGAGSGRTEPWIHAKHRAELAVRSSGMEWTLFRPSWIYGPGDRSLNRFVTFARRLPFVPVIGGGDERVQPLFVSDLANALAASVDRNDAAGGTFEAGGPETLSMNEIFRTMLRVLGLRRPLLHLPVPLMKAAGGLLQFLPNPPLTPSAIDFLQQDATVDTRAFDEAFGKPRRLEEALGTYLKS